jgi:hypothetical protein
MNRQAGGPNGTLAFGQPGLRMSAPDDQRARILIIEDDPVMLCMAGDYLERHNSAPSQERDGKIWTLISSRANPISSSSICGVAPSSGPAATIAHPARVGRPLIA